VKKISIAILFFLIAGCASTTIVGYRGQGYEKNISSVTIISIASDLETRDSIEEKLVSSFSKKGINALKTVQLIPFLNNLESDVDNPELSQKLKTIMQNSEAVLTLELESTLGGVPYEWKIILQTSHGEIWSGKSKTSNTESLNSALNSLSIEIVDKLKIDGII